MTNSYFSQVPNFDYINRNPGSNDIYNYVEVKNLFKRGKLRPDIINNLTYFEKYTIIHGNCSYFGVIARYLIYFSISCLNKISISLPFIWSL